MKTLKQLLDQVSDESGFDKPDAYIGSYDPNIAQLVATANRSAILLRDLRLQYLVKHASIPMVNGTPAFTDDGRILSYALPDDFYTLVPDTTYQSGRLDNAILPSSAPVWAYLIARLGVQTLPIRCRIIGNRLDVFSPMEGETIEFEYISNGTIRGANVDTRFLSEFSTDADVWLLDDALIELDIIWRYKRAKGLDWQGDFATYQKYENEVRGRDSGSRTIGYPKDWPYPNEPYANLWVA